MLLYIEGGWSHALNGNPRGGSRAIPAISVIDLYVCVWDILHQFGSVVVSRSGSSARWRSCIRVSHPKYR